VLGEGAELGTFQASGIAEAAIDGLAQVFHRAIGGAISQGLPVPGRETGPASGIQVGGQG
jgi:hypothetical protein